MNSNIIRRKNQYVQRNRTSIIKNLFDFGKGLTAIRNKIYPNHKKADRPELNRIICEALGFNNVMEFRKASEERDKQIAEDWEDQEKADMIKNLFENGYRLEDIRNNVFPQMKWVRRGVMDQIILSVLDCDNWDDYEIARRRIYTKNRSKLQSATGWPEAKKEALKRDGFKCTVTGIKSNLDVHHIDGNFMNNDINNLVTLCKDVHIAVTYGANGMTEDELKHWENYRPKYASFIRKRIKFLNKFAQILRGMGYQNARIERQLFKGRYQWIVVRDPTDLHIEPGADPLEKSGKYNEDPFHDLISKLDYETE